MDSVKEAFKKVKEDIFSLREEVSKLREDFSKINKKLGLLTSSNSEKERFFSPTQIFQNETLARDTSTHTTHFKPLKD